MNLQAPYLNRKIVAFCTLEAFTVDMPEILFKSTFQNPQVEEIFASIVVKPPIISKNGSKMPKNPQKSEKW